MNTLGKLIDLDFFYKRPHYEGLVRFENANFAVAFWYNSELKEIEYYKVEQVYGSNYDRAAKRKNVNKNNKYYEFVVDLFNNYLKAFDKRSTEIEDTRWSFLESGGYV